MAERQRASKRPQDQQPPRRNDVIRCERCGEDYAITYKSCPFCDERPGRGGVGGKRAARNTRGGGYGRPVNPIQIVGLGVSMVLIIAALFIVFTKLGPLFFGDGSSSSSSSSGQSSGVSSSVSSGVSSSVDSSAASSSGDVSADVPPVVVVQAISLSREDFTLNPGEKYQLMAAVSPADVTEPVVWSSSDSSSATVDDQGYVTNVNGGTETAVVTITASCGNQEATCIVRCKPSGTAAQRPSSGSVVSGSTGTITGAGSGLNVRSGPGSSYEKVASLANGNKVTILGSENGWYKVDYGNGKTGYVSADYVKVN